MTTATGTISGAYVARKTRQEADAILRDARRRDRETLKGMLGSGAMQLDKSDGWLVIRVNGWAVSADRKDYGSLPLDVGGKLRLVSQAVFAMSRGNRS